MLANNRPPYLETKIKSQAARVRSKDTQANGDRWGWRGDNSKPYRFSCIGSDPFTATLLTDWLLYRWQQRPNQHVIDFGAGAALDLSAIKAAGSFAHATAVSLAQAPEILGIESVTANLHYPQTYDHLQPADLAVSRTTIVHTVDPVSVIEAILNKLKPGGTAIISTPGFEKYKDLYQTSPLLEGHPLSQQGIKRLLELSGMRDVCVLPVQDHRPAAEAYDICAIRDTNEAVSFEPYVSYA